jgi:hypothetical protein
MIDQVAGEIDDMPGSETRAKIVGWNERMEYSTICGQKHIMGAIAL